MKYTIQDFILEQSISETSFDDLACEELLAEGAVLEALTESYVKQYNLLTYMQEDGIEDTDAFDIFAEGVIVESKDDNSDKDDDKKKPGFFKTVGGKIKKWILNIIRMIKKLINKVINFFKGIFTEEGRFNKKMENAVGMHVSMELLEGLESIAERIQPVSQKFSTEAQNVARNEDRKGLSLAPQVTALKKLNEDLDNLISNKYDDTKTIPNNRIKELEMSFKKMLDIYKKRAADLDALEEVVINSDISEGSKSTKINEIQAGLTEFLKIQRNMDKIIMKVGEQAISTQHKINNAKADINKAKKDNGAPK